MQETSVYSISLNNEYVPPKYTTIKIKDPIYDQTSDIKAYYILQYQ